MNLWGVRVTETKATNIEVPEDRDLLVTRFALAPGTRKDQPTYIYLTNHEREPTDEDREFIIGTLRAELCEHFELDINVASGSKLSFRVKGPGEIHITGYYNRLGTQDSYDSYGSSDSEDYGSNSFDDDGSSDDQDSDLNARINRYMGGDSSSGEDYDDEGRVETVSEDDSDMDDESKTKSPVKQKTTQQILPKVFVQPQPAKAEPQSNFNVVSSASPNATAEAGKKKKKKQE